MTVQAAHDAGQEELARELDRLRDREQWAEYAVQQLRWVQELGDELDLPVHLWPDKSLSKHVSSSTVAEWLRAWRARQSPEQFANREVPSTSPPTR